MVGVGVAEVQLVVQSDDFGMCHAVNVGTVQAFREGIVTQVSTMAACPWFTEAAALAREFAIPVGVHQTLTCEWDFLRWRPLTDGPSLVGEDGTFRRTVEEAAAGVTHADAVRELSAQAAKFAAEGLTLEYLDFHMGSSVPSAYDEVSAALGKPFIYGPDVAKRFASIEVLSDRDADDKKPWLLDYLDKLTPGVHLLVTHCAAAEPELAALHRPGTYTYRWAEEYRLSDQAMVTDPEIRQAIEDHNIELTTVGAAF
ncbi:ChbG/HpnK family deacetylase [Kribbella sindirgiensis]|uniref:ChbG/HpnK family deacetylase n=1 Tax=Kribbella sindirgiensis TaxID=1124744 RepID=A0A4R0IGX4_9ACTN|nr:ChbG/HpnK family deacetylase [Kribbella sindirgiensis]